MSRELVAALAGNPNVGKSSLFNRLTGMNQHTGNWTGKTVETAVGHCRREGITFIDLPGTYSMRARSAEETVARDAIRSGEADVIVAVCDASNIGRGLALAMQIIELTPRVVVCVNLMDEAKKHGIALKLDVLERELGVPVVGVSARHGDGIDALCRAIRKTAENPPSPHPMRYMPEWETELLRLEAAGFSRADVNDAALDMLPDGYAAHITARPVIAAEALENDVVCGGIDCRAFDRRLDSILTHPVLSVPIMLLLLAGILWLTVSGASVLSGVLESIFAAWEAWLYHAASPLPDFIRDPLIPGVLHTLFTVIAVMLPPMAIFFPLFTLAEDFGLLGRIAFNLDGALERCGACGKQALTMWTAQSRVSCFICASDETIEDADLLDFPPLSGFIRLPASLLHLDALDQLQ